MRTTEAPVLAGSAGLCRILSLDGGGAKGFYTLGVLKELEAMIGAPLHRTFNIIFGTSTGSIIAALLALGHSVNSIHALYKEHVPSVMSNKKPRDRSAALARLAESVFGDHTFMDAKTHVGIVATRWDFERPMIFKSDVSQAHGRQGTFQPGFGCTIAEAVRASCSAYPFFERTTLRTGRGDVVELIDGGYCANNPTLYAIADAVQALGKSRSSLRVVSLGVGGYPEPKRSWIERQKRNFYIVQLLQKTLDINTTSMEQLRAVLFKDVDTVRINDTFEKPEMATDLMESDLTKLGLLFQRGSESFAKYESDLKRLLADAEHINADS
jgi:predicted acylesterase/phospholipase RssA